MTALVQAGCRESQVFAPHGLAALKQQLERISRATRVSGSRGAGPRSPAWRVPHKTYNGSCTQGPSPIPADLASGGILAFTVTEPVPIFAEPMGSPGAACIIGWLPL